MTNEEVGRHRQALRVRAGVGQQELAERVGISRGALHKIERGEPSREVTLRALASALGVTVADYIGPDVTEPVEAAS